ncbi:hypothetical protein [Skermanella stibiiresistens]|uniref:hypothetical protein n=1 Tax=Skermanella stibiiresistens TaxID=913326 RepID=UPI0012F96FD7|nr:hypothetical protein [Skermanella stibiiresistens]
MKIVRLKFPGNYEDAYVYMGWLNIVTCNRELQCINLDYVARDIDAGDNSERPVATFAFARNDWLSSESTRELLKNPGVHREFFNAFDHFPRDYEVSLKKGQYSQFHHIPIKSSVMLDLMFYNHRLYIGGNDGLFHIDIDWELMDVGQLSEKRHDYRCGNLSAKFGMINSSCGGEGLHACFDDFHIYDTGSKERKFRKIADKSVRTSWVDSGIANYASNSNVDLYQTTRSKVSKSVEGDKQLATDVSGSGAGLGYFIKETLRQHDVVENSIQYYFNNNRFFFVHTYDGKFYCFETRKNPKGDINIFFTRTQKAEQSRILSAHPVKEGLIIETDDRVFLFSEDRWWTIFEGPVISVRTFRKSKRFQNLVAITHEEGVEVISIIDENSF